MQPPIILPYCSCICDPFLRSDISTSHTQVLRLKRVWQRFLEICVSLVPVLRMSDFISLFIKA